MCQPTPPAVEPPSQTIAAQTASNAATAAEQTKSNIDTAKANATLNNVNQVDANGNRLTYAQTGTDANGIPQYTATQTYGAVGQALNNTSNQTKQSLANTGLEQAQKLPGLLNAPLDLTGANLDKYTNTHFLDTFNQQQDRNQALLDSKLANQGIALGSAAFTNAQRDFADQRNSALNNMLGTAQQNAQSAILTQRETPINEISALAGGSQVALPSYVQAPQNSVAGTQIAGTNVAGITGAYNTANQNAYNSQVSQYNDVMGGLFGLGSSFITKSDERLKENIVKVGELPDKTNVYEYDFKMGSGLGTGKQIGVLAQEVEKTNPGAVSTDPRDGYKQVDYAKVIRDAVLKRKAA